MKSNCACSSCRTRWKVHKQYRSFKMPKPSDVLSRMTWCTKYIKRSSLGNHDKGNQCFLGNKLGHFAKNYPRLKRSIKTLQLFDKIADHAGNYLNRDNNLESMFSIEDELTCESLFSLEMYEATEEDSNTADTSGHNIYQILKPVKHNEIDTCRFGWLSSHTNWKSQCA